MRQIDVHKLSDEARFNAFHGTVLMRQVARCRRHVRQA